MSSQEDAAPKLSWRNRLRTFFSIGQAREKDRPLHVTRRAAVSAAVVVMPGLMWILGRFSAATERMYTEGLGQFLGRSLAWASGRVSFSVMETLFVLLVLYVLVFAGLGVYHVVRGRRGVWNAAACGLLRLGAITGVLALVFYVAWGFNYARADLITRLKWQEAAQAVQTDTGALARLCEQVVAAGNGFYEASTGSKDLGRPTELPMPVSELDAGIDAAYVRVAERLHLDPSFAVSRGRAKPVFLSTIMSHLLTLGFYSPWTGAAHYNRDMPSCRLPEVVAHEKAHQRGVTSEDEANFFGFLACIYSDNAYTRYSGYLMAQRQLLPELYKRDRDRFTALIKQRDPGVQRDADAINAFRERFVSPISNASQNVNNLYLKANRVSQGIKAYQRSAQLILAFAHENNNSCLVEPEK